MSAETYFGKAVHPAASVLPLMEGTEFDDLVKDIATVGRNVVPITLHEEMILDGRNRARAIESLQKEGFEIVPAFETWAPTGDETPTEYVQRRNLNRRSLTPDQRLAVVAKFLPMIQQERATRQADSLIKPGQNRNPHGRRGLGKLAESPATPPDPEHRRKRNQEKLRRSTAGQLAEKAGVPVNRAKKFLKATKTFGLGVADQLLSSEVGLDELLPSTKPTTPAVPGPDQWEQFKARVVADYAKLLRVYPSTAHRQVRQVLLERIKAECEDAVNSSSLQPSPSDGGEISLQHVSGHEPR